MPNDGPYYVPQSIAPILEQGSRVQAQYQGQPTGLAGSLPAFGDLAKAGFNVADQNQKKQSLLQAQQTYSQYLAKVDSGTATEQDHALGRMAAMSLGIAPPDTLGMNLKKSEIEKNTAQAAASRAAAVRPHNSSAPADLTPEEDAAWQKAIKEGRLAPAQISFRGPKRKDLAKQFLSDPTYNASQADANYRGGVTGAQATARVQKGKGYEIGALGGTIEDTLDKLQPLIPSLAPSQLALLNRAYQAGLKQVNDPNVNKALVYLNEATALQASVLKGGGAPTDEDIKLAKPYFNQGLNAQGFAGVREAIRNVNASRVGRLQGSIKQDAVAPHPQDSAAVQWAKANPNDARAAKILQLNGQ